MDAFTTVPRVQPLLGRSMHQHSFVLVGALSIPRWEGLLGAVTERIRMHPSGSPAFWSYPTEEGLGGVGVTLVQPITDSFIALDTWPDHNGAYLVICSCRPFDSHPLYGLFRDHGLTVRGEAGHVLRLAGKEL
jgi:hypothetical protein